MVHHTANPDLSGSHAEAELARLYGDILEREAELTDRRINDALLKELVRQFVGAERQLKDLNDLKNRFLGMAAHDLRSPLTSIIGMSRMLTAAELELDDETKSKFLTAIHRASTQMLELINDLLDVAAIESGHFEMTFAEDDLAALLNERIELLAPTAEQKGIELVAEVNPGTTCSFDRERLSQVIDNLISNAVKFSPTGAKVTISSLAASDSAGFAVADQGPGIPEDERDRLFGTFQKLSTQPTAGEKSTGLGLAIVKKIVDAHGGRIVLDSEVGKGTMFTALLPRRGA